MNISVKQSKKGVYLKVKGELDINDVAGFKEMLLQHLATENCLEIDLSELTKIDTAGLQLLYAAHQTARRQGKTILLDKPSSVFMETLRLAGLFFETQEGGHLAGSVFQGGIRECQKQL